MPTLIVSNNNTSNLQQLDLSQYLDLTPEGGADPYDPAFTDKVIAHSLLKEGGVLALEDLQAKELAYPLKLNAATASALALLVIQINQIVTSPGATFSWQDDGMSQPTIFDGISGQFDIAYNYRQQAQFWCLGKLRLFSQPLGHTRGPRQYAAASGVGPLLMISPYASGGQNILGASIQAGVAGFGGAPAGASSGVFYAGAPSVAGDGAARLQISLVGQLPNGALQQGPVPTVAVSLLPDSNYLPLATVADMVIGGVAGGGSVMRAAGAVASQYVGGGNFSVSFRPCRAPSISGAPISWAGLHRLFAIARASPPGSGYLQTISDAVFPQTNVATVNTSDWGLYDLGTFSLKASQSPQQPVTIAAIGPDVTALVMLPDNATWFFNPRGLSPSQYGTPATLNTKSASAPFTNTLLLDDILGDQYIYSGASQTFAPSPIGMVPSSAPITPWTRGLVPRPDPKNGLPPIAILSVPQTVLPSAIYMMYPGQTVIQAAASWSQQLTGRMMAQVNVREHTRYVLP